MTISRCIAFNFRINHIFVHCGYLPVVPSSWAAYVIHVRQLDGASVQLTFFCTLTIHTESKAYGFLNSASQTHHRVSYHMTSCIAYSLLLMFVAVAAIAYIWLFWSYLTFLSSESFLPTSFSLHFGFLLYDSLLKTLFYTIVFFATFHPDLVIFRVRYTLLYPTSIYC